MDTTLLKGLRLLEILARSSEPRSLIDLAAELDVPKSNAHRTLQTLISAGFVRQQRTGARYECTYKLFELGNASFGRRDLRKIAAHEMQRLAAVTLETIHLSTLDGGQVVYIDKIESPQPVRAYSEIGGRAPAHCVASGKAQLAFTTEQTWAAFPDPLPSFTAHTLTSRAMLEVQLRDVRLCGYAINSGEWRASVGGIAAPIFDVAGSCVAAIGVSGPTDRMTADDLERFSPDVLSAARAISALLGANLDARLRSAQ